MTGVAASSISMKETSSTDKMKVFDSVSFTIRFVYDLKLFKINLAEAYGTFMLFEENGKIFLDFTNTPMFRSGVTPLFRPMVEGIAVTEYGLAHAYIFRDGYIHWGPPDPTDTSYRGQKYILGGKRSFGGHRDFEHGQRPFWGREIGEGWDEELFSVDENATTLWGLAYTPEDIESIRVILYLFDMYLVYSYGSYWRPAPRLPEHAQCAHLTSILAIAVEFNRTRYGGWAVGNMLVASRNYTRIDFDLHTRTITIYVDRLPETFYIDLAVLTGPITLITALFVLRRRGYRVRWRPHIRRLPKNFITKTQTRKEALSRTSPEDLYKELLALYTNLHVNPQKTLERKINSYREKGLSREEAIRRIAKKEIKHLQLERMHKIHF